MLGFAASRILMTAGARVVQARGRSSVGVGTAIAVENRRAIEAIDLIILN